MRALTFALLLTPGIPLGSQGEGPRNNLLFLAWRREK